MSAESFIKFDSKQKLVEVRQSRIKNAGQGLFARKHLARGSPIVVYYGQKITDEEVYEAYQRDPESHKKNNSVIRGTPNGFSILGEKNENPILQGVYVNDVGSINCKKEQITEKVLRDYVATIKQCNLKTVDTEDYPVYVTVKTVKKGDELYAHYGIGYWLMEIGCAPEEISAMNEKYDFNSLYY